MGRLPPLPSNLLSQMSANRPYAAPFRHGFKELIQTRSTMSDYSEN
jgi:hypothetical protein